MSVGTGHRALPAGLGCQGGLQSGMAAFRKYLDVCLACCGSGRPAVPLDVVLQKEPRTLPNLEVHAASEDDTLPTETEVWEVASSC